jgi:hypothetical protein
MKIGSSATIFSQAAMLSGLWATQRNDYPTTVKAGHSISEIALGPEEILYTGINKPNLMLVIFPEGFTKVKKDIEKLTSAHTLFIHIDLPTVDTQARKIILDFKDSGPFRRKREYWAMMALVKVLEETEIYPLNALKDAIVLNPRFADENLAAVESAKGVVLSFENIMQ